MDVVVIGLINLALFMVIFVPVSQRLLGVRFGLGRLALGSLLTLSLVGPLMNALAGPPPWTGSTGAAIAFVALTAICSMLAGLIFLVLSEALVPTGSLPRARDLRRDLGGRIARTRRYLQILRIAVRRGLGPYLRGRRRPGGENAAGQADLARSLRLALDEAGVTFVKLGQVLSTRSDVIPASVAAELSRLQDQVSPAPWPEVEQLLTEELGAPPRQVFSDFGTEPLAAASVAQVYTARLAGTGTDVVVKVQRPGITALVERDLDIVRRLARMLERNTDWGRSMGVRALAEGFADAMLEELDFTVEASNMTSVAAGRSVADNDQVVVPTLHRELSTRRVLTMQRLDGVRLGDAAEELARRGQDGQRLAKVLFDCLLGQVAIDGVFHADPHPGNFLLLADGKLGMLDLGSVGRLDPSTREALQRFLLAVDHGDPVAATDALLEIVDRPDVVDEQGLERGVGQFMARHLGAGAALGPAMFNDLFRIITAHGLGVPPEVAAVFRALATVEGTISRLSPGFDLIGASRQFAAAHVRDRLAPDALRRTATEELATLLPMLRRLPRRIDRIAAAAESGRLGLNVRLFADERDRRHITTLLHQALLAILGATAGVMAVLLLGTPGGPRVTESMTLFQLFGYNLLVICAVLVLRVLVLIFRLPDARSRG
ncbi:ABC-1 domain protein [Kribbella flavida DSM 17836]|uniref:ABC-1 domain protein n=1 Tax=Kribbella flavida (strain DSM 17836 / JCM 10339 / NBRC 14399) TaxID=479435 RepID=D2PN63_KRIFD|nr:AarF/UbiB family protein [Kribbella flavida]ADB34547.1 ABC-1 domain protein [Kribbella flavida DSM 17836]